MKQMTNEQAARILDPATSREALAPYAQDGQMRLAVTEEACRVAVEALRGKDTDVRTNADRIRAMSDEELARKLTRLFEGDTEVHYCRELPECDDDMERDMLIPMERCEQCVLHWLQQPAEEGDGNG